MPPKRRVSGPATKSQQSTLAFHGASNKVTKSGVKAQGAKDNLLETKIKDATPEIVDISDTEPTTIEADIIKQTEQEVKAQEVESTPEEDKARRISDAAIKKYWAAKERQRIAPRVHQGELSLHDKVLREFDMSGHYGVSTPASATLALALHHVAVILTRFNTALHRHCSIEALEACATARSRPAHRSPRCSSERARCKRQRQDSYSAVDRRRDTELESRA
jgi:DNA polymerase delta subunit 4